MKKKLMKSNGIAINYVLLKSDGKIAFSVFRIKVESKNRTEVITKDMWYKLHPQPYRHSKKRFCLYVDSFCPFALDDGCDGYDR